MGPTKEGSLKLHSWSCPTVIPTTGLVLNHKARSVPLWLKSQEGPLLLQSAVQTVIYIRRGDFICAVSSAHCVSHEKRDFYFHIWKRRLIRIRRGIFYFYSRKRRLIRIRRGIFYFYSRKRRLIRIRRGIFLIFTIGSAD